MLYKTTDKNGIVYEWALAEKPKATLIWLWGFPSFPKESLLSEYLNDNGISICFPHYIGSWLSKGEFTPDNCANTVKSAIEHVKTGSSKELYNLSLIKWSINKVVIAGSSFGGYWALDSASKIETKKYLLLAPFYDIEKQNIAGDEEDINQTLSFAKRAMSEAYRGINGEDWNDFFRGQGFDIGFNEIRDKDFLIVHGQKDSSVKLSHLKDLADKLKTDNVIDLLITDSDHGLHKRVNQKIFGEVKKFILK